MFRNNGFIPLKLIRRIVSVHVINYTVVVDVLPKFIENLISKYVIEGYKLSNVD